MLHLDKRVIAVPLLLLFLTTTGCTLFRFVDNSTPEEIEKFETSKDDLWKESQSLKRWNAVYRQQLADQQAEIARMTGELASCRTEIARADRRVVELGKTIDSLNAQMKQRQEVAQTTLPPPKEPAKERKPVKIKVLTGNGNSASAKNLAKRLGTMGYPVKSIDKAARSDYKENTIFFGSGYETTAAILAKKLGTGAITKPLTWKSDFNIIVVTGGKP
jgi:septal ring factor EnvC (AmiA/AmiB activator)